MQDSYYDILGIAADASMVEVKKAYKRQAKLWHPDINSSASAKSYFLKIKQAYDTLSNYDKRHIYDLKLSSNFDVQKVSKYVKGARQYNYILNYEAWLSMKKDELKAQQQQREETILEKKNKIQQSPFYTLLKVVFYLKIISYISIAFLGITWCTYIVFTTHFIFFFLTLPLYCLAGMLIYYAYDYLKTNKQFYQK